jgi:hypothetical protein
MTPTCGCGCTLDESSARREAAALWEWVCSFVLFECDKPGCTWMGYTNHGCPRFHRPPVEYQTSGIHCADVLLIPPTEPDG